MQLKYLDQKNMLRYNEFTHRSQYDDSNDSQKCSFSDSTLILIAMDLIYPFQWSCAISVQPHGCFAHGYGEIVKDDIFFSFRTHPNNGSKYWRFESFEAG